MTSGGGRVRARFDLLVFALGLGYGLYFVLRFGGLWTENDTASFSDTTMHMLSAGTIFFAGQYPHGFGYPAWLGYTSLVSGLPVAVLNTLVFPVVGMTMVMAAALAAYRVLLPKNRAGPLAALLLLALPAVTFTILRGNHEKINITCILLAVICLVRLGQFGSLRTKAGWMGLLAAVALVNALANDYFGFLLAGVVNVVWLSAIVMRRPLQALAPDAVRWLGIATVALWFMLAVSLCMFPPATSDARIAQDVAKYLIYLLAGGHRLTNPIAHAASEWTNPLMAQLVGLSRWLLLALSAAIWFGVVVKWTRHRLALTWPGWLLLALYGGFMLSVVFAVPVDVSGLNLGNNLEVRNFTYLAIIAVPLVMWGAVRPRREGGTARVVMVPLGLLVAALVVIGELNITQDPVVSNQWLGYTRSEAQMVLYFLGHRATGTAWGGPDDRLLDVGVLYYPGTPWYIVPSGQGADSGEWFYLDSRVVRDSTRVAAEPLPPFQTMDRVYDDGGAQIFMNVPTTPFQP